MSLDRSVLIVLVVGLLAGAGPLAAAPAGREAGEPWLGVLLGDAVDGGVQLVAVVPGGPAARQGLLGGDVVVAAAGRELSGVDDLERVLDGLAPGERLTLRVLRSGRAVEREVALGRRSGRWTVGLGSVAPEPPPPAPSPPDACGPWGLCVAEVTADLRRHYGAPDDLGLLVTGVVPGLGGATAGVRVGDILLRIGDRELRLAAELERVVVPEAAEIEAGLIRERRPYAVRIPALRRVAAAPPPPEPVDTVALRRTIQAEIRRLQQRIAELEHELARLDGPR